MWKLLVVSKWIKYNINIYSLIKDTILFNKYMYCSSFIFWLKILHFKKIWYILLVKELYYNRYGFLVAWGWMCRLMLVSLWEFSSSEYLIWNSVLPLGVFTFKSSNLSSLKSLRSIILLFYKNVYWWKLLFYICYNLIYR